MTRASAEPPMNRPGQALSIPVDTVRFIIGKLRECGNKGMFAELAEGSCLLDSDDVGVLHSRDNPCRYAAMLQELHSFIDDLPEDHQVDLVALAWLGRDNCLATDWPAIRGETTEAHYIQTARYLTGMPMVDDFLEEGLSTLGFSVEHANVENPSGHAGNATGMASPPVQRASNPGFRLWHTRSAWWRPSTQA